MNCVLCNSDILIEEKQHITTCGHVLHENCARNHFKENYHCPHCNKIIEDKVNAMIDINFHISTDNIKTQWKMSQTLDSVFKFLSRFRRLTSEDMYIKINGYIYKSTESYNLLNVPLYMIIDYNDINIDVISV